MVTLTGVGLYIVILYIIGICANLYYAGQGGTVMTSGQCLFGGLWSILNLFLLLTFGFNV